ncbi:MAG TPA: Glu/Leu/Phe/Val dehydrogenase dimerization domain-containing protein [Symbiobacteriaceae bacterium]
MGIFDLMERYGHEQVVFCYDRATGLKAIIGIHDTSLGPALGGVRLWPYQTEEEALRDVLRLSQGMTYKNAAMGLDLGGGKAVIWAEPGAANREALMRAFGRFVQTLGGRYVAAEDVNTTVADMAAVAAETPHVAGRAEGSGDPSPVTAYGVFHGMRAAARWAFGSDDLQGRTVAVQGLGKVGYRLCEHLHRAGARLIVTDTDAGRVQQAAEAFGAQAMDPERIYDAECDIFSPCALGSVVNDRTVERFRCRVIAGSANNQLQEPHHGDRLQERGILYAPDFIINGGGVINAAEELRPGGYRRERALVQVERIYDLLLAVFRTAQEQGISTARAAEQISEERIALLRQVRRIFAPR